MVNNYNDLNSYDYFLPEELIAQAPLEKRTDSRLLYYDLEKKDIIDNQFSNIVDYFDETDVLVFNETKVRHARLLGNKVNFLNKDQNFDNTFLFATVERTEKTLQQELKGSEIEFLILTSINNSWKAIAKPAKRLKKESIILLKDNYFIKVVSREENTFILDFYQQIIVEDFQDGEIKEGIISKWHNKKLTKQEVEKLLEIQGQIPLPPYIQSPYQQWSTGRSTINSEDEAQQKKIEYFAKRYQSILRNHSSVYRSAAAPTASLHFDENVIQKLKAKGVAFVNLDLEIGLGTFATIKENDLTQYEMHGESYFLPEDSAERLNQYYRDKSKKITALGTTALRALEDNFQKQQGFKGGYYTTELFLRPPHKPQSIEGLLTNFHLPKSTLLILICSFLGFEKTLEIYRHAVQQKYRFFSFGDCMLLK